MTQRPGFRLDRTRRKETTLKFVDKTKNQPQIQAAFENARSFIDAIDLERKRRRREDRRRLVVKWIGGFLAFIGINGSFIIFANMSGIIELLFDQWRLWPTLAGFLLSVLYVGYAALFIITFFWISDKTGFNFWIEDWIEALDTWDILGSKNILKFKEFPRKERRVLVRDLDKVLNIIGYGLMNLEREADDNDDEKLSDSVQSIDELIGHLPYVSSAFLSLGLFQEHASWKKFTSTLEETAENLKLELKDIAKYHEKVQPALKMASLITANVLSIIIDKDNRNEAERTVSILIQALQQRQNS